jgi:hypothetical protein
MPKSGSIGPGLPSRRPDPDRGELTMARRFFANTTEAERDLIAYWQMVKLVEKARLRHTKGAEA